MKTTTVNKLRYISVIAFIISACISTSMSTLSWFDICAIVLGLISVFFTVWYNKLTEDYE